MKAETVINLGAGALPVSSEGVEQMLSVARTGRLKDG